MVNKMYRSVKLKKKIGTALLGFGQMAFLFFLLALSTLCVHFILWVWLGLNNVVAKWIRLVLNFVIIKWYRMVWYWLCLNAVRCFFLLYFVKLVPSPSLGFLVQQILRRLFALPKVKNHEQPSP